MTGGRVDLGKVRQGDQMVVSVVITPEQRRTNPVIIADLLPAGFEIEAILKYEDGLDAQGAFFWVGNIATPNVSEARDDRFVAAIDARNEPVTLAYVVRAVTPGEFALPGAVTEDMYRADVFARSDSQTVTISGDEG